MIDKIFGILPKSMKDYLRGVKERIDLKKSDKLKKANTISQKEVRDLLQSFHLDCDVFLHTSLRKIGYEIEGGKEFVAAVIKDVVDLKKHTLLVSALPFRTTMKEFLDEHSFVDMRNAPNAMGAINNIFMADNRSFRSLHPTHSVVAIGNEAEQYVAEHHFDKTPFGVHSPYYKLMENNGKILLFGVDLTSMTFTHVIEDLLGEDYPVDVYLERGYDVEVIGFDGQKNEVITKCHDPKVSSIRDCESIRKYLIEAGAMVTRKLGVGEVSLVDAKLYNRVVCKLLLEKKSIYGDVVLSSKAREKVANVLSLK